MRLNKYLARCGIGSRRKCDDFISNSSIKVNGKIIIDYSYQVKKNDIVQYKNKNLNFIEENYIYILNKPEGYLSSTVDILGRKTIFELFSLNVRNFYN